MKRTFLVSGFLKEQNMALLDKRLTVRVCALLQTGLISSICRGTDPG